ncbi:hypothetical protein BD626DRAFT_16169 [Schizophyllum amplum]|uniref:NAD(P)-binding protein n=1 Tax=Schizophyllum amplum TaxID=97359 RepID=A0A550CY36_9AGAR|nr:hypothetical protein BD626DRAFT_16169 [Auriculariopsis ampla]
MATERDQLVNRVCPQMMLSTKENPLTAVKKIPDSVTDPKERASLRFATTGNAIVTGGAGNLGMEFARALLEHGMSGICLFDLEPSFASAHAPIDKLRADFPDRKIVTAIVNVADSAAVEAGVAKAAVELGSIDTLISCAGIVCTVDALEHSLRDWQRVLDVNTTGSWLCAQAVGKRMVAQGTGGSIVFIASISGHSVNYPQPQIAYNASKAAVIHVKDCLAAEWARYGIRVNSISPGYMDTILNEGDGLAAARAQWYARNPMGRMGDPTEIVGAGVLLCSLAGRYINGTDIVVDGGGLVF